MSDARQHPVFVPPAFEPAASARRTQRASAEFTMAAQLDATMESGDPAGVPGPVLSLESSLALAGLQALVTFRDRPARAEESGPWVSVRVPLVFPGEQLQRPRLTLPRAPRRPLHSLHLSDGDGRRLNDDRIMTEYSDRAYHVGMRLVVGVKAVAWLAGTAWLGGGPRLRVNGKLVFTRGMSVWLDFGRSAEDEGIGLPLVHPGTALFFSEGVAADGVRGEPWVWLTFLGQDGSTLGAEQLVGRCARTRR